VIKERVGKWIDDTWDHTTLVNRADAALMAFCEHEHVALGKRPPYVFNGEPTAENIAIELHHRAGELLAGTGVSVTNIKIYETPTSCADYCRGDRASA
jgi:6-pyruvoyl-tetrahydropterin synthase